MSSPAEGQPRVSPSSPSLLHSTTKSKLSEDGDTRSHCDEPSCWYDDGNVVLQAEDVLFKVYKGILSQESEVFKSMFALPQPTCSPSEVYDGCPLVVLQDKAFDFQVFIRAIFDHTYLCENPLRSQTCASLLALTTKYQAQRLRKRVMDPLSQAFPSTLDGFRKSVLSGGSKGPSSSWSGQVAIANAARASGTLILLPAFLLSACLRPLQEVLDTPVLDVSSRDAVITGVHKLSVMARKEVFPALFCGHRDLSANCSQPAKCYQGRHEMMEEIEEQPNVYNPFHIPSNIRVRRTFAGLTPEEPRLCQACAPQISNCTRWMHGAWEKLPGVFGLGTWEELRKAEKNAAAES